MSSQRVSCELKFFTGFSLSRLVLSDDFSFGFLSVFGFSTENEPVSLCANGGSCTSRPSGFTCNCTVDFWGPLCQNGEFHVTSSKHTLFTIATGLENSSFPEFRRREEQCFHIKLVKFQEKIAITKEMVSNSVKPPSATKKKMQLQNLNVLD